MISRHQSYDNVLHLAVEIHVYDPQAHTAMIPLEVCLLKSSTHPAVACSVSSTPELPTAAMSAPLIISYHDMSYLYRFLYITFHDKP
jgi:hypothetical protein